MRISGWTSTPVGRAVDWLDRKSSPEPDTDGNLEHPSYVQVALGGSSLAGVRDSSDMGAIMAGLFMPGTGKVVGGLSAAAAQRWAPDNLAAQSAVAAVVGGGLGAAVAALGQGPGLLNSVLIGAASGVGGSLVGPRYGQLVRTLSCDAGAAAEAGLKKSGIIDKPLSPMARTLLGAVPIGMSTELAKAAVYADGGWKGIVVGGLAQTLQLIDVLRQTGDHHTGSEEEDVLHTLT